MHLGTWLLAYPSSNNPIATFFDICDQIVRQTTDARTPLPTSNFWCSPLASSLLHLSLSLSLHLSLSLSLQPCLRYQGCHISEKFPLNLYTQVFECIFELVTLRYKAIIPIMDVHVKKSRFMSYLYTLFFSL
jgi:hypothetical protein